MNEFNNDGEELTDICDKVRFAVSVGDELDEEMQKHINECEECRTFLEQSKTMANELKALGVETLTKNGKSLADSVMEEVARQEIFTKGKPVKSGKGGFKHLGLVAACLVIAVVALPIIKNGIPGSKDSANQYAVNDAAAPESDGNTDFYNNSESKVLAYGAAEEECADTEETPLSEEYTLNVDDGKKFIMKSVSANPDASAEEYNKEKAEDSAAINHSGEYFDEYAQGTESGAEDAMLFAATGSANRVGTQTEAFKNENAGIAATTENTEAECDFEENDSDNAGSSEYIEEAARTWILESSDGTIDAQGVNVTITAFDGTKAEVTVLSEDGIKINLVIEKVDGTWLVIDVFEEN